MSGKSQIDLFAYGPETQQDADLYNESMREGRDNEIIAQMRNGRSSDSIQRQNMHTLLEYHWINDEPLNCYLKHVVNENDKIWCEQIEAKQQNGERIPSRRRSYCFSSFFFAMLLEGGSDYNFDRVQWFRRHVLDNNIFELKYVFFPYNYKNLHWEGVVVFMEKKRVRWYDSFGQTRWKVLKDLMRYLKDEWEHQYGSRWSNHEWKIEDCEKITTPQQQGGES